jgi:flavin-dependent dehydrogenase
VTALRDVEVAIVGGGPAGAALAIRLASAGREVALFERTPAPRWRAAGVFTSPATRAELLALGLDPGTVASLCRPISALTVEAPNGARVRLDYGEHGGAVGLDRVRFEEALLARARAVGAAVHAATPVRAVSLPADGARVGALTVAGSDGEAVVGARVVIGADGPRSLVGRAARTRGRMPLVRRAGVTVHREDPDAPADGEPVEARMVLGRGWYCGIAPVPRGRVNVGIVVPAAALTRRVAAGGSAADVEAEIVAGLPAHPDGAPERWRDAPRTDQVRFAVPLAHRATRVSGGGFLLVGDATGFLDPISGEGIHRALVSAELAADAITSRRLERYGPQLRSTFRAKDAVSWTLQGFLSRPALLGYALRRLELRRRPRETFTLVMADLVPPIRALDPRFLAAVLAP